MSEWYFWLTPIAVLAVFLLFRFVGCQLIFEAQGIDTGPYGEKILAEPGLVSYWRLHEGAAAEPPDPVDDNVPVPGGKANDAKQVNHGVYIAARIVTNGTPSDSADAPGSLKLSASGLLDIGDGSINTSVEVDGGYVEVPKKAGLGIEIDEGELAKANALYKQHGLGARDDAIAMRQLIPNWQFDNKRPCMVR